MTKKDGIAKPRALLLDDDRKWQEQVGTFLEARELEVDVCGTYREAESSVHRNTYDAFIVDLNLRDVNHNGLDFLKIALKEYPTAAFVILSGLVGPLTPEQEKLFQFWSAQGAPLRAQIDKLTYETDLDNWAQELLKCHRERYEQSERYHTKDERVKKLVTELVPIISRSSLPVLVLGESGTGKEEFARLIHEDAGNPNRSGPFVAVNCAAISDTLILSELFGHVMNSFTGAESHRLGWFLEASGWKDKAKSSRDQDDRSLKQLLDYYGVTEIQEFTKKVFGDQRKFEDDMAEIRRFLKHANRTISSQYAAADLYCDWLKQNGNTIQYVRRALARTGKTVMGVSYEPAEARNGEFVRVSNSVSGTLFLDEVGDLSPAAEVALLRALDGYGIRPIGYTGPALLPNCRIIAATNRINNPRDLRNPSQWTPAHGSMRRDLFYRLSGWVVTLPPLRDRRAEDGTSEWVVSLKRWADSDGLMLDMDVLRKFASRIEEREDKELWDGNWRELRQVYERAKAYAEFPTHSGTLDGKALEFASQWVLVESRSGDDSIRSAGDGPGEVKSKLRWTLEECVGEEKIVRKFGERQFELLKLLFNATNEDREVSDEELRRIKMEGQNLSTTLSTLRTKFKKRPASGWMIHEGERRLRPSN